MREKTATTTIKCMMFVWKGLYTNSIDNPKHAVTKTTIKCMMFVWKRLYTNSIDNPKHAVRVRIFDSDRTLYIYISQHNRHIDHQSIAIILFWCDILAPNTNT